MTHHKHSESLCDEYDNRLQVKEQLWKRDTEERQKYYPLHKNKISELSQFPVAFLWREPVLNPLWPLAHYVKS